MGTEEFLVTEFRRHISSGYSTLGKKTVPCYLKVGQIRTSQTEVEQEKTKS